MGVRERKKAKEKELQNKWKKEKEQKKKQMKERGERKTKLEGILVLSWYHT